MTTERDNVKLVQELAEALLAILPEEMQTKFHQSMAETPDPTYNRMACSRCGAMAEEPKIHTQWHRDLTTIMRLQVLAMASLGSSLTQTVQVFGEILEQLEEELPNEPTSP